MLMLLRHLLSIVALPFVVSILIPVWLARRSGVSLAVEPSLLARTAQLAGLSLVVVGLVLFVTSLQRFATDGRGTLAPWDPPRRLVLRGPYRFVRNPMISGVIFVLFGEALLLGSRPHLLWALTFVGVNLVYIPLLEEPMLVRRFGAPYQEYCRHVPRVIPRVRPWRPDRQWYTGSLAILLAAVASCADSPAEPEPFDFNALLNPINGVVVYAGTQSRFAEVDDTVEVWLRADDLRGDSIPDLRPLIVPTTGPYPFPLQFIGPWPRQRYVGRDSGSVRFHSTVANDSTEVSIRVLPASPQLSRSGWKNLIHCDTIWIHTMDGLETQLVARERFINRHAGCLGGRRKPVVPLRRSPPRSASVETPRRTPP